MLTFIQEKFLTNPNRLIAPCYQLNSDLVARFKISYKTVKAAVGIINLCATCQHGPVILVPKDRKQSPK